MSKKNFKDPTANIDRLFSNAETYNTDNTDAKNETYSTQKTPWTPKTQKTQIVHNTSKEHYRINLKLRPEYKEYLTDEAWKARKSITEYINDLIQSDKDIKDTQNT